MVDDERSEQGTFPNAKKPTNMKGGSPVDDDAVDIDDATLDSLRAREKYCNVLSETISNAVVAEHTDVINKQTTNKTETNLY